MNATLKIDPDAERKFKDALGQIISMAGKAKLTIMMEQMVLLVKDAMKLTPPMGDAPITEKIEAQKAIGERAIRRDLTGGRDHAWSDPKAGIFAALDHGMMMRNMYKAKSTGNVRLFVAKDKTVYGVESELFRPDASDSEIKAHHQKYRSKRTGRVTSAGARDQNIGRWKFVDKMVIEKNAFNRYLETVFSKVLTAKAGWVYAWQRFQVALGRTTGGGFTKSGKEREEVGRGIPAILRKLKSSKSGHYINAGTEEKPVMEAGNTIPYAQRWVTHVIKRAWSNRVRNIQKQADRMAKELAKSLRQKGIDANA